MKTVMCLTVWKWTERYALLNVAIISERVETAWRMVGETRGGNRNTVRSSTTTTSGCLTYWSYRSLGVFLLRVICWSLIFKECKKSKTKKTKNYLFTMYL